MKVKLNPRMAVELERELEFHRTMQERAETAKAQAELLAPRGRTGHYADSFDLRKAGKVWRLSNTDFAAHWVEWGSIHNPPYAPTRRAIRASGLSLDETPKT